MGPLFFGLLASLALKQMQASSAQNQQSATQNQTSLGHQLQQIGQEQPGQPVEGELGPEALESALAGIKQGFQGGVQSEDKIPPLFFG